MGLTQTKYYQCQVTDDALCECKYAPIFAVDEAYVVPLGQPAHTLLLDRTWSPFNADNKIIDATTMEPMFSTSGNVLGFDAFELFDHVQRKFVLVCHSRDVVTNSLFSFLRMPLTDGTKGDRLASISADWHVDGHLTIFCKVAGEQYKDMPGIYVKAAMFDMFFFLGHPKEPGSILLARMDASRVPLVPDTMELKIAPGVDMALIVSLCVLADYVRRQRQKGMSVMAAA
ncbi:hypothetical protein GGF31_004003 [Allomyces arbusculus]|nr:hypothetical protein GGF31_004003 [Allomyces arbusculus]